MPTKKQKKSLRKKYDSTPKIELDEFEKAMLGEDSYDDIDYLNKSNEDIQDQIDTWNNHKPSSWLGSWYKQIQLDKLKRKLNHYQTKK